ncbi:MAG: MBL fold metallo-hydrolase [Firmicutes bacterium]|nr:MBL fold metallo-hydrolase [Bacillota bacterium]HOB34851.1 MBL fold metallo-hydrolase [Bacillota bacterium]HPZ90787.1 MBL fold metallo-hydrolase [Bacillota bacterium]HQE01741.1 MBL fold metallo-hydrolase [Bacillota bacterium]
MEVKRLQVGDMATNCYLAWCPRSREAAVIDPGGSARQILEAIAELQLNVKYIVNTHGHLDHIGANAEVKEALKCPLAVGREDSAMLTDPRRNLSYQLGRPVVSPPPDILLEQGDVLELGDCRLEVLATPGHTPGGVSLYGCGLVFVGDTLFQRSIGRSDLPGGQHGQLLESIREKLLVLPPETRVLPGHGPGTTIGAEKAHNPWLQG